MVSCGCLLGSLIPATLTPYKALRVSIRSCLRLSARVWLV
uniref:Uncharacterized protein n=1 Tax=Arundo donax TaxID=35708 RepID=A0A0A9BNM8_ARUDO